MTLSGPGPAGLRISVEPKGYLALVLVVRHEETARLALGSDAGRRITHSGVNLKLTPRRRNHRRHSAQCYYDSDSGVSHGVPSKS